MGKINRLPIDPEPTRGLRPYDVRILSRAAADDDLATAQAGRLLQDTAEWGAKIAAHLQEQQVNARSAEAQIKLMDLRDRVDSEPDYNKRPQIFFDESRKIRTDLSEGLTGGFQDQFFQRFDVATKRAEVDVNRDVLTAQRNEIRGEGIVAAERFMMIAARSIDQDDRSTALAEAEMALDGVENAGAFKNGERALLEVRLIQEYNDERDLFTVRTLSDSILAEGGSESEMVRRARAGIDDGDIQDEVVKRVKLIAKEREAQETTLAQAAALRAYSDLAQSGIAFERSEWPDISDATAERIQQFQLRRAEAMRTGGGPFIENDYGLYRTLADLRDNDPRAFAKVDLTQHILRLEPALMDSLMTAQQEAKDPSSDFVLKTSQMSGMRTRAKMVYGRAEIEDEDVIDEMLFRAENRLNDKAQRLNRDLTFQERDEIINEGLRQLTVQQSLFGVDFLWKDKRVRVDELTAEDRAEIERNPPPELREFLRQDAASRGVELDDPMAAVRSYLDVMGVPGGSR